MSSLHRAQLQCYAPGMHPVAALLPATSTFPTCFPSFEAHLECYFHHHRHRHHHHHMKLLMIPLYPVTGRDSLSSDCAWCSVPTSFRTLYCSALPCMVLHLSIFRLRIFMVANSCSSGESMVILPATKRQHEQ